MPNIGQVAKEQNGNFIGKLNMITVKCPLEIIPNRDKTKDNQPDYRVFANGTDVGAGWNKTSERSNNQYISLQFASPELGNTWVYANLVQDTQQDDPNVYTLVWNPKAKD